MWQYARSPGEFMTLPETPVASSPSAAAAAPAPAPASAYPPTPKVIEMMVKVNDKVSDLIFSPHRPPQVELNGALTPVPGLPVLTVADTSVAPGNRSTQHRISSPWRFP